VWYSKCVFYHVGVLAVVFLLNNLRVADPMTSLSATSHPVAMLLPVVRNDTFCTATMVRKKARECTSGHTQNILLVMVIYRVPPNPNIKVVFWDSSRHISGGAKGSRPLRMGFLK
jgi:hypothetical protein